MNKPTLVLYQSPYQSQSLFHSTWFRDYINQRFDITHYDTAIQYNNNTIFVIGAQQYLNNDIRYKFENYRVLVDSTWESNTGKYGNISANHYDQHLIIFGNKQNIVDRHFIYVPKFFWFNESLCYLERGYDKYQPRKTYKKKFLMPIGASRGWREAVIEKLEPFLEDAYWSCLRKGYLLPNTKSAKRVDTRLLDPCWYDDTFYSIICESARSWEEAVIFLTEKTYKAIAGHHPFMLMGACGLLEELKNQGFVTFDNLFDESYDNVQNLEDRLKMLVNNITNFIYEPYTSETLQRIEHNINRFYSQELVYNLMDKEIYEPIMNWIVR